MRWLLVLLIGACARSERRITSEPASCCVSSASAKPIEDSPEAAWTRLLSAMRTGDDAMIERYTTANGRASLMKGVGTDDKHTTFARWGKGWSEWETRWRKKEKDRAEAVMGPEVKEHGLLFIRENGAWKLEKWSPGE